MKRDPWTDPDPQPDDFDEWLERATPDQFETVEVDPNLKITFISDEEAGLWRLGPEGDRRRAEARRREQAALADEDRR